MEDYEDYQEYEDYEEYEDYDTFTYGRYAGSYAQDVEGYDDDTIDSAFEGNPDMCWNID